MPKQIDLSHVQDLINEKFKDSLSNDNRWLILYGGGGSGKSVFAVQKLLLRIIIEKNHKFLIVRKVGSTIKESCFDLFKTIINDWGLSSYAQFFRSDYTIEFPAFDSKIIMKGMDDPEKIKSISNITGIWVEETSELDESDLDQLNLRLRGETESYKQIILTFNPISRYHWLKKKFFDQKNQNTSIVHSTYLDNKFIDDEYKNTLENDYNNNPLLYDIYVRGEWGTPRQGNEMYSSFNSGIHISKDVNYNPEHPLIISLDFNVLPYSACLIGQKIDDVLYIIDEICLEHPFNRPNHVIRKFVKKYPNQLAYKVFVTGDASGKNASSLVADGINHFTAVFRELDEFNFEDNVPASNYNVIKRIEFINSIFSDEIDDCKIVISDRCKNLIEDLQNVKTNEVGGKLKQRIKDKRTGQTYEKFGHLSDAFDYMITTFFKNKLNEFTKGKRITDFITVTKQLHSSKIF